MIYILGVITGILIMGFLFAFKPPIERTMNQLQSRGKAKGVILEPEAEELSQWLDNLKDENPS